MSNTIPENIKSIRSHIDELVKLTVVNNNPQVMIVTKKQEPDEINRALEFIYSDRTAYFLSDSNARKVIIGENFVQDFVAKKDKVNFPFSAHLIGRIQESNIKKGVELFDVIQSCHNLKIVEAIQKAAKKINKQQKIFLQINISDDENKGGFNLNEIITFLKSWKNRNYSNLNLQGFMTITKLYANREDVRFDFKKMKQLQTEIHSNLEIKSLFEAEFCRLSMGMSNDYDIAIEEGATIVRIGSAVYQA